MEKRMVVGLVGWLDGYMCDGRTDERMHAWIYYHSQAKFYSNLQEVSDSTYSKLRNIKAVFDLICFEIIGPAIC
jgi:hypothetical protein